MSRNNSLSDCQICQKNVYPSIVWEQFKSRLNPPGGSRGVVKRIEWSAYKVDCAGAAFMPRHIDLFLLDLSSSICYLSEYLCLDLPETVSYMFLRVYCVKIYRMRF